MVDNLIQTNSQKCFYFSSDFHELKVVQNVENMFDNLEM